MKCRVVSSGRRRGPPLVDVSCRSAKPIPGACSTSSARPVRPDVNIPTEDSDAWLWYPEHRWVYDKIAVAQSQGLDAAPHGVPPPRFPVFSKPITNLKGMGIGSRVLQTAAEYEASLTARPYVDAAARRPPRQLRRRGGRRRAALVAACHRHAERGGHVRPLDRARRARAGDRELLRRLDQASISRGYTGILNIETIGGRMIEVHLRMSDQWPDLYGAGWVDAVVRLYHARTMGLRRRRPPRRRQRRAVRAARSALSPSARRDGRAGAADAGHFERADHVPRGQASLGQHAMPPGGFRLAVVNAWSLQAGRAGRERLRGIFLSHAA